MNKLLLLIGLCLFGVAFAEDLPVTEKLVQKTGVSIEAHIGGQVFKVMRTSPLPNAFGRADIFGRTVGV